MKILQVIPFFTPSRGGSVIVAYDLSIELARRGHKVTIITTDFEFDEDYAKSIEQEGVKVQAFKCLLNMGLFLYSPSIKKWLLKNIRNFDVIHMHNFRSYQNNVVYEYAKKFSIPYILQAHGSVVKVMGKENLKRLYDVLWGYSLLKNAQKLIAVSEIEMEQYKKMGVVDNKIVLIPNGLNLVKYEQLPKLGSFRQRIGIKNNFKIILFLGRVHKIKGIDFLIKAFSSLLKDLDNVILIIAGPDEDYKKDLEVVANECGLTHTNLKFVGYIKNTLEAYQDADLLVYPASYEIFGLVPFESIMCNTPVVVTSNCGCGNLVEAAECGYLVEYGNVNDLIDTMRYALKNPVDGEKRVKKGRTYITNYLSLSKIVEKVEDTYENSIY